MREMAERAWFVLARALGGMLRSARYSEVRIVSSSGVHEVRKRRRPWAPILVALGAPLVRVLDTGVRVLPRREWEAREGAMYRDVHGAAVRAEADGTLVLPHLGGETLASILDDAEVDGTERARAIELAAVALADFHARGFSHGDAMAENVVVDLDAGVARWFDFETVHDARRSIDWRRADDLRALLATCLLRTERAALAETIARVLDAYGDDRLTPLVAASFVTPLRRALIFHLGQAPLDYRTFREIGRVLGVRVGEGSGRG